MTSSCDVHADRPATAACASCERAACDGCLGHTTPAGPVCDVCARLHARAPRTGWWVALGAAGIALTAAVASAPLVGMLTWTCAMLAGFFAAVVGNVLVERWVAQRVRVVERATASLPPRAPYRDGLESPPRSVPAPRSGLVLGAVATAIFAAGGAAALGLAPTGPAAAAILIGAWWLAWAITGAIVVFAGRPLARDPILLARPPDESADPELSRKLWDGAWQLLLVLDVLAILVAVVLVGLIAFALVDLVIPTLVATGVALAARPLAVLARRVRSCAGQPVRAVAVGVLFATAMTTPVALATVIALAA